MTRLPFSDRLMHVVIYFLLLLLAISTLYPFWNSLVISFNKGLDTSMGGVTFWPRSFTVENYQIVFKDQRLLNGFAISILRTILGTVLSILATSVFAYGLSKRELIGRQYYMIICIITMYFSGGLIPAFLLIRGLGLVNSFWVYIIPSLIGVWNMIIFKTFFQELPKGLEESANIDGCGNWGIFLRIILPLSGPVVATLSLFTAIAHWNDWFLPSIYITNENLLPIQTMLRQILNSNIATEQMANMDAAAQSQMAKMQSVTGKSLSMATMMVATLPIVLVYPFVQKYFVKGVLVGSLKE